MIELTRKYRFSASHRLHVKGLSEEENYRIYGKCNNPHGHGHNYELSVRVAGELDKSTGSVVPLQLLDELIHRYVISVFDHKSLELDVPDFQDVPSTTENLAAAIRRRLQPVWSEAFPGGGPRLENIRVQETKRNMIDLPTVRENV